MNTKSYICKELKTKEENNKALSICGHSVKCLTYNCKIVLDHYNIDNTGIKQSELLADFLMQHLFGVSKKNGTKEIRNDSGFHHISVKKAGLPRINNIKTIGRANALL